MIRLLLILISFNYSSQAFSEVELINYQVKKNDTLFSIAKNFNTDISNIYSLNPNFGLRQDYIKTGENIIIPITNQVNYSKYCSYTAGVGDAKNLKVSFKTQINDCIIFLSTEIDPMVFNNFESVDWEVINQNNLYQIYLNHKVAYLLRFDEDSKELKKYLKLIHESALNNNEISIMGLYANEYLLHKRELPDVSFNPPYIYEMELPSLAQIRKKVFSTWQNLKYIDTNAYAYFHGDIDYERFCSEVLNKPSTSNYSLLLNASSECASYYDDIGSNKWKMFTDRAIELIDKQKIELIYPIEYSLFNNIIYLADFNNIIDYYESFLDNLTSIKCPTCGEPEDLLDLMEAYESIGDVSYGQIDSMRYIRMNHAEYLGEKYLWDSKDIAEWGNDLIYYVKNDLEYLDGKEAKESHPKEDINEIIAGFQLTYLDSIESITKQLINNNSCEIASAYYEQYVKFDNSTLQKFYLFSELSPTEFILPLELANCYLTYSNPELFEYKKSNFNHDEAKKLLSIALNEFNEYLTYIELNKIDVQESEILIYTAYYDILNSYNYFISNDKLSAINALANFKKFYRDIKNKEIQSVLYPILDSILVKYVDLFIKLELDNSFLDPFVLKNYKDNLISSIRVTTKTIFDRNDSSYESFYDVQKKLLAKETAVIFFTSSLESKIVHISKRNINIFDTVGGIEINFYIQSLLETLNDFENVEFDFDSAMYLYDILISPYEHELEKDSVVKIIGSNFSNIPFSVFLRNYNKNEENQYKKLITSDWILKHYNFVRVLSNGNNNYDDSYQENFLGYANSTSYKWSGLPNLSETKREVTKLGITSNAKKDLILVNNDATKEKFLKQFQKSYKRIVIATHAVPPFWNGATYEPSLLFRSKKGDFFLSPSEIIKYNFSSDMVVLSSCNTSSSSFIGLFDAFIIAGAKSVVHSNWNLESKFASEYTTSFFEELWINENAKHVAMRDVAINFMNDYSNLNYMHPSFWGNFSIIYSEI